MHDEVRTALAEQRDRRASTINADEQCVLKGLRELGAGGHDSRTILDHVHIRLTRVRWLSNLLERLQARELVRSWIADKDAAGKVIKRRRFYEAVT